MWDVAIVAGLLIGLVALGFFGDVIVGGVIFGIVAVVEAIGAVLALGVRRLSTMTRIPSIEGWTSRPRRRHDGGRVSWNG
jgi:hypothetical protein